MRTKSLKWPAAAALACAACAHQPGSQSERDDPLRNTKKLVAEGHATLYRNGAFQVPMTTIHLIPAGPDAISLASELAFKRAAVSFQDSIKHARESVNVAKAGVDKSVSAAGTINRATGTAAEKSRAVTSFGGRMIAGAPGTGGAIVGASVSYAKPAYESTRDAGAATAGGALATGGELSERTDRTASALLSGTASAAGAVSRGTAARSRRHASFAAEKFVKGYAAAPAKLGQRAGAVGEAASLNKFVSAYQRSDEWRASTSGKFSDVIVDTTGNYGRDVHRSFGAAKEALDKGEKEGYTLAMLKSLRSRDSSARSSSSAVRRSRRADSRLARSRAAPPMLQARQRRARPRAADMPRARRCSTSPRRSRRWASLPQAPRWASSRARPPRPRAWASRRPASRARRRRASRARRPQRPSVSAARLFPSRPARRWARTSSRRPS